MTAYIYALIDPRIADPILQIRYVGMTSKSLDRRLRVHLSEARKRLKKYRKQKWIASLLNAGVMPGIIALDIVPLQIAFDREIELIAHYKSLGCRLVNGTSGGEGLLNPSPEIRAKIGAVTRIVSPEERARRRAFMLGRKHSPEILAKLSVAKKGKPGHSLSSDAKEKIRSALRGNKNGLGKYHSEENKRRWSLIKMGNHARLGMPHQEITKRKISIAHAADKSSSAKLTWDQVRAIRSEYAAGGTSQASLRRRYGIAPGTLCVLLQGKTWIETPQVKAG